MLQSFIFYLTVDPLNRMDFFMHKLLISVIIKHLLSRCRTFAAQANSDLVSHPFWKRTNAAAKYLLLRTSGFFYSFLAHQGDLRGCLSQVVQQV